MVNEPFVFEPLSLYRTCFTLSIPLSCRIKCSISEWEKGAGEPPEKKGDKPPKGKKDKKKKDKHGKKPKELRENPDFEDIAGYEGSGFGKDSEF